MMVRTLIRGAEVFDTAGTRRRDLLIEDEHVVAIDASIDLADERAAVVDARGMSVLPGFIDVHVHVSLAGESPLPDDVPRRTTRAMANAADLLRCGVTSARDLGGFDGVVGAVKEALVRGESAGPRLQVANQILCATGGHGTAIAGVGYEADGPDGLRRAVRLQARRGADLVKVTINGARNRVELTQVELQALVDEAHRLGMRVACHASVPDAVAAAVRAGVDTVEHGNGASEATLAAMANRGTVLVPTVSAFQVGLAAAIERVRTTPDRGSALAAVDVWQRRVDDQHRLLEAATAAGVTIAVGSDAIPGTPVDVFAQEVTALAELGLNTRQVVAAATAGGAAAMGHPSLGRLEAGGPADLVVVAAPAKDVVGSVSAPLLVVKAGELVVDRRVDAGRGSA